MVMAESSSGVSVGGLHIQPPSHESIRFVTDATKKLKADDLSG